ncbi:hypothetical protein EXY23_13400 [Roseicella aquatilis]|uniref:Uncharacterized protein n=1 Tax=Roseicella aquatilis TaxID=2527868 RepID=A0A4R4DN06_9PROT|nr:hypothetical protein EXY23_13400 [Roseicella aquatilis]
MPKALIAEAVREGVGEEAVKPLAGARKADMAETAAGLLDGVGWVPRLLRVPAALAVEAAATARPAAE